MKKLTLPRLASAVLGALFFLAVPEEPDGGGEADRAARIRTLLSRDLADELARGQRRV